MINSILRLSLDIQEQGHRVVLNVKRGDTGRSLHITLMDGGIPYKISEDCYAVFTAKKPDSNPIYNDCSIENGIVIYDFTYQTVAVAGTMNCEIKLYGSDDKLVTSARFNIIVADPVYHEGDEVESSAEFDALAALIADFHALKDGKSAYEYAKEGGYTGTEEEFAAALANISSGGGTSGGAGITDITIEEA